MKQARVASLILMLMAFSTSFAQYLPIFTQPYNISQGAYTSTYDPGFGIDYMVADNFSGLTEPITKFEFYGVCGLYGTEWVPGHPDLVEPFKIRFYELEGGWTEPPASNPGVLAPSTGTYTVNLYDTYGDGWNGGMLDVYVNGTLMLNDITLAAGAGPLAYTFPVNAGEYILTVFTAGGWPEENWYEIVDPFSAIIATDGPNPTGIGVLSEPPLVAPADGIYTVNLCDTYGDGWNGGSLDVYVNGLLVLDGITLASGTGPEAYTFPATAGEVIATVYSPGSWPAENWYEILDPTGTVVATDGPNPSGIGFISTYITYEPDWQNPLYTFDVNAITTYVEPWDVWYLYKFEVALPTAINLAQGWISAQNDPLNGSGQWFLWQAGIGGDAQSYQNTGAKGAVPLSFIMPVNNEKQKSADRVAAVLNYDMGYNLYTGVPTQIIISDPVITPPPGVTVTGGGTIPPDLVGPDSGIPAVLYTIEATGTWDITVYKPADWTTDWYCWINVGGNLIAGPNPIPAATLFHTFTGVDFGTKAPATVVINDNQTLPVELSSFAAVLTSEMFVNIAWVSQSETNHLGYNILRGLSDDAATAIKLNDTVITECEQLGTQRSYAYLDTEVSSGITYWYWLEGVSLSGTSQLFGPVSVLVNGTPDDPETPELPPVATTLLPAFPNPFNPNTNIRYYLKDASGVKIDIYNTKGQLVRSFTNNHVNPGFYQIGWDGKDLNGNLCSSGIYMYRMNAGKYSSSRRMVLAK